MGAGESVACNWGATCAGRARRRALAGDAGCRRCLRLGRWLRHLGDTANAHHPHGRQRHDQPQPFGALGIGHFGPLPMPTAAFGVLGAARDPGAHARPARIGLIGRQVGQNQPGFGIRRIPTRQQGAVQLALARLETGDPSAPGWTAIADDLRQRLIVGRTRRPILSRPIDAQEWMPPHGRDRVKQPAVLQAPIGEHDDRPIDGGDTAQRAE